MCDFVEDVIEFDPSRLEPSNDESIEFVCLDDGNAEYIFESEPDEQDQVNYEYLIEGEQEM